MKEIPLPNNFNREMFIKKYKMEESDFYEMKGFLYLKENSNIEEKDLMGCVLNGVSVPEEFDGRVFMDKYSLKDSDFYMYKGLLYCVSLPKLKKEDLLDCCKNEEN